MAFPGSPGLVHPVPQRALVHPGTPVGTTTHSAYDSTGNVTQRTVGANAQTLTYDNRNNLTQLNVNGTPATTYVRGTDGNVLIRRDPTSTTLYLGEQEFTRTTSGTITGSRRYNHAGTLIAERTAPTVGTGTLTALFTDPNGTATLAADWTTSYTSQHWYDPYGNPLDQSTDFTPWPLTTGRGFLNKPTSPTTGIIDMGARAYDPTLGQFLTLDPILDTTNTHTLNGYSYTGHEPINHTDPTGLMVACGTGGATCSLYGSVASAPDAPTGENSGAGTSRDFEARGGTGKQGGWASRPSRPVNWGKPTDFLWGLGQGTLDVGTPPIFWIVAWATGWSPGGAFFNIAKTHGANTDSVAFAGGMAVPYIASMFTGAGEVEGGAAAINTGERMASTIADDMAANNAIIQAGRAAKTAPIDVETAKLTAHLDQAVTDFNNGLIPASSKELINLANPKVADATRGTMIDRQAKMYIDADSTLAHLWTTKAGYYGPDVMDPASGRWWDFTTQAQWGAHFNGYADFGLGIGLFHG